MNALVRFIPNALTLTNAMMGVMGMFFIANQQVWWAVICVAIALVMDFFDGFVARLLNVQSELGKQLDSLADAITFGALPGFILFQQIAISRGILFEEIYLWSFSDVLACSVGLLVPAAAVLRLGVFNLDTDNRDYFVGLPTPAMAIFVISLPLILEAHYHLNFYVPISDSLLRKIAVTRHWMEYDITIVQLLLNQWFLQGLAILFAIMMNANLPMIALKFKGFSWQHNKWKYSIFIWALFSYLVFLVPYIHWIRVDIGLIDYLIVPIIMLGYFILSVFYAIFGDRNKEIGLNSQD